MAIALTDERAAFPDLPPIGGKSPAPERPAALTVRGEAAVHLIRFEDAWAELGAEDRRYLAGTLEDLAWEAKR